MTKQSENIREYREFVDVDDFLGAKVGFSSIWSHNSNSPNGGIKSRLHRTSINGTPSIQSLVGPFARLNEGVKVFEIAVEMEEEMKEKLKVEQMVSIASEMLSVDSVCES